MTVAKIIELIEVSKASRACTGQELGIEAVRSYFDEPECAGGAPVDFSYLAELLHKAKQYAYDIDEPFMVDEFRRAAEDAEDLFASLSPRVAP